MKKGQQRLKIFAKPGLRQLRARKGLTMTKLAQLSGYSVSSMAKIELRRNGIKPDRVQGVLDALGKEFDDLFEFVDGEE